jgi:hypothetical protein
VSSTNQTQFSSTLAEFAEKLRIKAGTLQKKITFDMHGDIMQRTPVDTGRARANWFATVGEPSKEVHLYADAKSGDSAIPQPQSPPLEIDGTRDTYIINNLPYIKPLDEGHSKQAPNGMVKLAMAAQDQRLEEAVRNL